MDIGGCICVMETSIEQDSDVTELLSYKCGDCNIGFGTVCQLHEHLKSHVGENGSYQFFFEGKGGYAKAQNNEAIKQNLENTAGGNVWTDVTQADCDHEDSTRVRLVKQHSTTTSTVLSSDVTQSDTSEGILSNYYLHNNITDSQKIPDHTYIAAGNSEKCDFDSEKADERTKKNLGSEILDEQIDGMYTDFGDVSEKENKTDTVWSSKSVGFTVSNNTESAVKKQDIKMIKSEAKVLKSTGVGTIEAIDPLKRVVKRKKYMFIPGSVNGVELELQKLNDTFENCPVCYKKVSKRKLDKHLQTHKSTIFICDVCAKVFSKKSLLTRHQRYHKEYQVLKCHMCPASFSGKREHQRHINSHIDFRPYVCQVCDKRFQGERDLSLHQERMHMGILKFQCEYCERAFTDGSCFRAHRATHFEPTLKCQYCDRKFRHRNTLIKHERTHSDTKHFQCHLCNRGFNQCTPYFQHMDKSHDLDKTYLKDVMKCVAEARRREGKKLDVYRVPDNIDEIIAKLRKEDEGIETEDVDQQNILLQNKVVQQIQASETAVASSQSAPALSQAVIEGLSTKEAEKLNISDSNMVIYAVESKDEVDLDLTNCYILLQDMKGNITP